MNLLKPQIAGGIVAITTGILTSLAGVFAGNVQIINIGLAGILIGSTILALKSSDYIKKDTLDTVLSSYHLILREIVRDLGLEGNALYIPPYINMPRGGIFIPLREDFDLDLGRLHEDEVFLTSTANERQMGLVIRPPGYYLIRKFEEHLEGELSGIGVAGVESVASSVLKSLGLADRVYIEEEGEKITVHVSPTNISFCKRNIEDCPKVACPVCSSILLGLARATGEVIYVEEVSIHKNKDIKITAKRLGKVKGAL